jgi:hypothetical protein
MQIVIRASLRSHEQKHERRKEMKLVILFFICLFPALIFSASSTKRSTAKTIPFVSLSDSSTWKPTKACISKPAWTIADSVFEGSEGWIANDLICGDFVLQGEFLYNGNSQGGIVIRGDGNSNFPWLCGYKMDIDADAVGEGHISFPYRPQPNPGVVRFPANVWQSFSIKAKGDKVSVNLRGKEVLVFTDDMYRYGQICLEGEKGGIRYRNLKIQKLDKTPFTEPRSPWTEIFDQESTAPFTTSGPVSVYEGALELNATDGHAQFIVKNLSLQNALVEMDVWCQRYAPSRVPYFIGLRTTKTSLGFGFSCGPSSVTSETKMKCTSQFPMFQEIKATEIWRFELNGNQATAFRFGEKVLTCADTIEQAGSIAVAADSCVLVVRGIRYKEMCKSK